MKGIKKIVENPWLSLILSSSTWFCCVLPALFVALGAGGVWLSLWKSFPALLWLGEQGGILSLLGLFGVGLNGWNLWRKRHEPCPLDPQLARACLRLRRMSWGLWGLSVIVLGVGVSFQYFVGFE
ncbi:MAG: hypothetical protein N2Z70_00600 [Bdellovibrionaceae bacterium]|nr:hypothetical protein [Pseudobdellovibrionaceae bacterium]